MSSAYRDISRFSVLLALSVALPYAVHAAIPGGGRVLLPMHIPVQLAGFLLSPLWGMLLGLVAPPFNFVVSGMPPFPLFLAMMLELGAMGFFAGLFSRRLPCAVALAAAVVISKVFLALGFWLVALMGAPFAAKSCWVAAFGAIVVGAPGIAAQLIIVPIVVAAVRKGKTSPD